MSKNNQQAALAGAKARIATLERSNATLTASLEECKAALQGAEASITQMVRANREVVDNLDARMRSLYDINERLQASHAEKSEELRKATVLCSTLRKEKAEAEAKATRYSRRYTMQAWATIVVGSLAVILTLTGGI